MNTRRIVMAILGAALVFSLSGCGAASSPTPSGMDIADTAVSAAMTIVAQTQAVLPTNTAYVLEETPAPVLTPTPVVLADCFISFHFAAWQDRDGNGQWEASEPPLAGVKFPPPESSIGFAQIWGYPYLSKADGRVTITTWSPGGCPEREVTLTAVAPALYEPTMPVSIHISLASTDFSYEAQFGFRSISR